VRAPAECSRLERAESPTDEGNSPPVSWVAMKRHLTGPEALRSQLAVLRMTQTELAAEIGCSPHTISNICSGRRRPGNYLLPICRVTGLDPFVFDSRSRPTGVAPVLDNVMEDHGPLMIRRSQPLFAAEEQQARGEE
jgi:Helix-turn-helix domain